MEMALSWISCKEEKGSVISYSVPTWHQDPEMKGSCGNVRRCRTASILRCTPINVKFTCVMMPASNKGRAQLLITDRPGEMSHCTAAFRSDRREEKHRPFLTYVLYLTLSARLRLLGQIEDLPASRCLNWIKFSSLSLILKEF